MINKPQLKIPILEDKKLDPRSLFSWCDRINSLYPAPDLPLYHNPQNLKTSQIITYSQKLELKTWLKFKQRAEQAQLIPQTALLAIYAEILACWSKNPCFSLSVITSDRLETEELAINLLALDYSQRQSFLERGKKIQTQLQQNSPDRLTICDRFLSQIDTAQTEKLNRILGFSFTTNYKEQSIANRIGEIWLQLEYSESETTLEINFNTLENLFPPNMVADMLDAYCHLLTRLSQEETAWKETTRQLIPPAQLQQRAEINNTNTVIPEETLYSLFIERAKQQPHQIALVSPQKSLTYQELSHSASQIGRRLQSLGVRPQTLVGIVMEKGWEQIVAVLGILAVGAAYVPIDPELPLERLYYLLDNSGSTIILTQSWLSSKLSLPQSIQIIALDREDLSPEGNPLLVSPVQPDDLAYIIYTSGSTGLPKGVMITHRNVVNVVIHTNQRFQVNSGGRSSLFGNVIGSLGRLGRISPLSSEAPDATLSLW